MVETKLQTAKDLMVKNAEKIEDSIRDRIQTAKDDTWDEFSL